MVDGQLNIEFVDLNRQYLSIKGEIDFAIQQVIEKRAFFKGEYVERFEKNWAALYKRKHCIGVANATDGLFLVMKALGIEENDEVIIPTNTFMATAEAVNHTGARPVFVDCDPETYNIDLNQIEARITGNTKAILPVHLYGMACNMEKIVALAQRHGLYVIEDCAQSHLASWKGQLTGTWGIAGVHSFYPGKNLGAYGDAGAVITDNSELADKVRRLADHGRLSKFDHDIIGYSSRLDGLQAAVLLVKMNFLYRWTEMRIKNARLYTDLLKGHPLFTTPKFYDDFTHVYHLYVLRLRESWMRGGMRKALHESGVSTGIHYPKALHNEMPYTRNGYNHYDFPIANTYQDQIFSLPIFPELSKEEIKQIADLLLKIYDDFKGSDDG